MKKLIKTIFLFLLLSTTATSQVNEYGLYVISDIDIYNEKVAKNDSLELVDIKKVIPNIRLDIRYATANNFTGEVIYKSPKAYMRKYIAQKLAEVEKALNGNGLGLKVFDAYRPYAATVKFYEVYEDKTFVASPKTGSVHNRGAAIDLTIIDLKTGEDLQMPTPFDDFTKKASHKYNDLPKEALASRLLLKTIMEKYGFISYVDEWWHYSFYNWKDYDLMDLSIEEL
ncbi:MAG: M15 family metallopeptidase [Bacteroidota bacterium]